MLNFLQYYFIVKTSYIATQSQNLSKAQANLKLALWSAEVESVKSSEMYAQLQELGLP